MFHKNKVAFYFHNVKFYLHLYKNNSVMKIKMLPNWCKKLGFSIFLLGFIISGYKGFMDGMTGYTVNGDKFEKLLSDPMLHLFDIVAIAGMLIYVFSQEKIEDDYINKLRLESYQLTALIGLGITVLLYILSKDIKLTLDYFIILFLWLYLITFALKKRAY